MKVAVIIPTFGRPDLLARLLAHLEGQHRPPDAVIVSAPDPTHVPDYRAQTYELSVVTGGAGLCAQRNRALELALVWSDIITFFDDDFLPADDYIARLLHWFQRQADTAVIMGNAEVDGAQNSGLTFDEGLMALRVIELGGGSSSGVTDEIGAYGCNMSMRTVAVGNERFDERLALYGWQEDIDFTGRLRAAGRVIKVPDLLGVHLGHKAGRVSGVRFGYSQVANPTYLMRKGTIPPSFGLRLMLRNICTNVVKSLWPESYVDRRGRLKGNAIGILHVAQGRIEPEYILRL